MGGGGGGGGEAAGGAFFFFFCVEAADQVGTAGTSVGAGVGAGTGAGVSFFFLRVVETLGTGDAACAETGFASCGKRGSAGGVSVPPQ